MTVLRFDVEEFELVSLLTSRSTEKCLLHFCRMLPWALKIKLIFSACRGGFKQPDYKNQMCFSSPILPKHQVSVRRATWTQRNLGSSNVRLWPALERPCREQGGHGPLMAPMAVGEDHSRGHPAHPDCDAASWASDLCRWPQDQEWPLQWSSILPSYTKPALLWASASLSYTAANCDLQI